MKKTKGIFFIVGIGLLFIVAGTVVLWFNEVDYAKTLETIAEVKENVVEIQSDKIFPSNNGKLVVTNGPMVVLDKMLQDQEFHIGIKTAKLVRKVEMYQWEEDEDDLDGSTVYTYDKVWSDELIDSSFFHSSHHDNPSSMPYPCMEYVADQVKVGSFYLSSNQIKNLSTGIKLNIPNDAMVPYGYRNILKYITNSEDPNHPEIGDIRISFLYNNFQQASILAVQQDDSFISYSSKVNKQVNQVERGSLTSSQILFKMKNKRFSLWWGFRVIGIIFIVLGYIACLVSGLRHLTEIVVYAGGGLFHTLLVMVIVWIRFRPLLCISISALSIGGIILIRKFIKKKSVTSDFGIDINPANINNSSQIQNIPTNFDDFQQKDETRDFE